MIKNGPASFMHRGEYNHGVQRCLTGGHYLKSSPNDRLGTKQTPASRTMMMVRAFEI